MFYRILAYCISTVLLVACSSQSQQPTLQTTNTLTQTPSPTNTSTPTITPTATLTPTPTPLPMAGPITENVMIRLGKGWVNDLTFSPNGKVLSVATSIGVYLYQVETMELILFLPTNAFVKDTVFIDDETLVVGSRNGATTVWNIKGAPTILETLMRSDLVVALGVTEENSILIIELGGSGASGSVNVVVWDRVNPENVNKVSSEYVFNGEFSSVNNILALDTWMQNIILVDTQKMKTTATICRKCSSFALSQNGDLFAANQWLGGTNNQMLLIDTTSQKEIAKFDNGGNPLAFSPDGKLLVSSTTVGLNFWNAETFELVNTFDGEITLSATFSPDGTLLASVSRDGNLAIRRTDSGETMSATQGFTSLGNIIFQDNYMVSTYEYKSRSVLDTASGGGGFYSLDGRTIYFRDLSTGEITRSIEFSSEEKDELGTLTSTAFSPDGAVLASTWDNWSSHNRTTLLINTDTGERLKKLNGFDPIAFSPDGSMLATGVIGNQLVIWDIATGEKLPLSLGLVPAEFNNPYKKSLVFSPDGSAIAILSDTVILRDLLTGKQIKILQSGLGPDLGRRNFYNTGTGAIGEFSPDGTMLASTWLVKITDDFSVWENAKGVVLLWDVIEGKKIAIMEGHSKAITALTYSPDGNLIATGAKDNKIIVWDAINGNLLKILEGHAASVNSLAFSSDGKLLYSNALDGTVIIWNIEQLLP